jgi:hypothetical protein
MESGMVESGKADLEEKTRARTRDQRFKRTRSVVAVLSVHDHNKISTPSLLYSELCRVLVRLF